MRGSTGNKVHPTESFMTERLDRIQARRLHGGINTKHDGNHGDHYEPGNGPAHRKGGRNVEINRRQVPEQRTQYDTDQPPDLTEEKCLEQELAHDVAPTRTG